MSKLKKQIKEKIKMPIIKVSESIFEKAYVVDALVNPVNCVGVMGKGLAKEFKERFPENFKVYKMLCENKELKPGKLLVHYNKYNPKYIINFPTKDHWKEKSKLDYIEKGLKTLCIQVNKFKICSISIPALGCGLGGLKWEDVYKLIVQYMSSFSLYNNVIVHEPENYSKF